MSVSKTSYQKFRDFERGRLYEESPADERTGTFDSLNEADNNYESEYIPEEEYFEHEEPVDSAEDIEDEASRVNLEGYESEDVADYENAQVDNDYYGDHEDYSLKNELRISNELKEEDARDIRLTSYDQVKPYEEYPHQINRSKPPKTETGIKILKSDLKYANNRVHELLIRLRMNLSIKADIPCSVVDHVLNEFSDEGKQSSSSMSNILPAASALAVTLRKDDQLRRFVSALATTFRPGEVNRIYLAFIVTHRLLHPFSTDTVDTTKLVLSALEYQVHESRSMLELFSNIDPKFVIARTIFISDSSTALAWNPLAQPMPVLPNVSNETVFTLLLRMYSIRRDVSSFLRIAWQQAIPSIVAILEPDQPVSTSSHSFKNLLSVANRLLECILREDIAAIFPSTAQTVCQAVFEVGGIDSLHVYILNLIILPNIVKLLRGDHESIENEAVHDKYSVTEMINQYYNLDIWWPAQGFGSTPFNPINTLIWLVWRLYTGATLLETAALEILTCEGFFAGGPLMDLSRVANQKIRNILVRLQHRSDNFCKCLLSKKTEVSVKPLESLSLSLVSKEEMAWLSRDILREIELTSPRFNDGHASSSTMSLVNQVKNYIALDESVSQRLDSFGEDLLLLDITNPQYNGNELDLQFNSASIQVHYDVLYRAVLTCNRYEASLIRMISAVNRTARNNSSVLGSMANLPVGCLVDLNELIEDKSWYVEPECTLDFSVRKVELYDRHTVAFTKKTKESMHGFDKPVMESVAPLPVVKDAEYKSRQAMHAEMEKTLRFGSSIPSVSVGTSIARSKHQPSRFQTKVNDDDFILGNRSRYTKTIIHPASSLLVATEAQKPRKPRYQKPNRFELDKEFMQSMRGHDIIPTAEFLRKRHAAAQLRYSQSSRTRVETNIQNTKPAPRPFPAYLRNTLRTNDFDDTANQTIDTPFDINKLISDYNNIFSGSAARSSNPYNAGKIFDKDEESFDNSPRREQRSFIPSNRTPQPPEAIPGVSYLAPTQSLLNRCMLSKDLLDELNNDAQPSKIHGKPFKPSGNNIVPPTGSRIPSYWSDADDDAIQGSVSSRRSSRSRRRRRTKPRSRGSSFDSSTSSHHRGRSQSPSSYIQPMQKKPSDVQSAFTRAIEATVYIPTAKVRAPSPHAEPIQDPSPITYRMEYNQPSTEYVPISRNQSGYDRHRTSKFSSDETLNQSPPTPPSKKPLALPQSFQSSVSHRRVQESQSSRTYSESFSPQFDPNAEPSRSDTPMHLPQTKSDDSLSPQYSSPSPRESQSRREDHGHSSNPDEQKEAHEEKRDPTPPESPMPSPEKPTRSIPVIPKRAGREWSDSELTQFLTAGVKVVKYGREGYPKAKKFYYDETKKELVWTASSIFSSQRGSIPLADVQEVLRGIHTDVMQKARQTDPSECMSLVCKDRTLDLVFVSSGERDKAFKAVQLVLKVQGLADDITFQ